MTDIPEVTAKQLERAIPAHLRKRFMLGQFESGEDIATLRRFVGLTQAQFAQAMGISVHTLRNWEQGRRRPDGPAVALLRIAARHPRIIRENLQSAKSCRFPDDQREVLVRRVGRRVILEPADEWSSDFLEALRGWDEPIQRPPSRPVSKKKDPFE